MVHPTNRRAFLRDSLLVSAGACTGVWASDWLRETLLAPANADDDAPTPKFDQRLRDLGIELPPQASPVAVYVPAVVTGNLLFTAGHIPRTSGGELVVGRIGDELTLEQGVEAARLVGLQILSTVRESLGTLDRISRLVKVVGMVNCVPGFTRQPQVVNGFSELMIEVFGDQAGKAARSAVGMGSLPLNVPVEIEAIFEITPREV